MSYKYNASSRVCPNNWGISDCFLLEGILGYNSLKEKAFTDKPVKC